MTIRRKTLRRMRQLVYKDNWSTTTVCRMRHLVYSFFYLRHLVEKKLKHNYSYKCNLTLRVHCGVIFGGVLDCVKCFDIQRSLSYHFSSVIVYW